MRGSGNGAERGPPSGRIYQRQLALSEGPGEALAQSATKKRLRCLSDLVHNGYGPRTAPRMTRRPGGAAYTGIRPVPGSEL